MNRAIIYWTDIRVTWNTRCHIDTSKSLSHSHLRVVVTLTPLSRCHIHTSESLSHSHLRVVVTFTPLSRCHIHTSESFVFRCCFFFIFPRITGEGSNSSITIIVGSLRFPFFFRQLKQYMSTIGDLSRSSTVSVSNVKR